MNSSDVEKPSSDIWLTARANVRLRNQVPAIKPTPRDQNLSLSYNQERLWLIEQLQPNTSLHNLLYIFRLKGELKVEILKQCLQEVTQRHEALRTTFPSIEGKPIQSISPAVVVDLPVVDLSALSLDRWEAEVQRQSLEYANQPFSLTQGPLWRYKLLRLNDEQHVLVRVIHHIIFDASSQSVFMRELGALYDSFLAGEPSTLPKLPIQYADFAQSQREWLQGNILSSQLDYWKEQLSGNVCALELPTDFQRSGASTYQGALQSFVLSESLTSAVKTLSYNQGVSLFVTLLTIFKVLLHRYTEQSDLVVCSPVAGRYRSETKGLIGYFNNVVVMRSDFSENLSFQELLKRISQVALDAQSRQDIPLQKLAEFPNLARTPLTRAMFVLQNSLTHQFLELEGLTILSQYVDRETANFELSLSMQETEGQLVGILQYKTDLFNDTTIVQMLENFQTLLATLIEAPDRCLADLPLFGTKDFLNNQPIQDLKAAYDAPQDELEKELTRIWEQVLGIQPIGRTDNFFDLGGHSLLAVQLFGQIERTFNRALPLSTLFQAPTIAHLATILRQEESIVPWHSLVPIQKNGSKLPLFCMHGGGLNILIFRELANDLGPDRPLYGLQAKGLDGKAEPHTCIEDMAADYIKEMQTVQPHGPYFLAGLSNGGVIGLEIAQQLQSQGESIGLLAMFDTYGPDKRRLLPPLFRLGSIVGYGLRYTLPRFEAKLKKLGGAAFLTQLFEQRRHSKKMPDPNLDNDLVENTPIIDGVSNIPMSKGFLEGWVNKLHLFVLQHSPLAFHAPNIAMPESQGVMVFNLKRLEEAQHQARIQYQPSPYSGCITIFRAMEQPPGFYHDRNFGWSEIAKGGLEIYDVPGHHSSITQSSVLAKKLKDCLDRVQ
jgi:thioesterase domain-containing protein/acyl carrier protein